MYRCGFWLVAAGLWLAVLGLFFSDPSGQTYDMLNLFRFALHGLEVQMFRVSADPPRYLVNVLARDWLLGCIALMVIGAILMARGRQREARQ